MLEEEVLLKALEAYAENSPPPSNLSIYLDDFEKLPF